MDFPVVQCGHSPAPHSASPILPPMHAIFFAIPLVALPAPAPVDNPGFNERVSVSSTGAQGNDSSGNGLGRQLQVSEDGRFVVFTSFASNLVPGDTNGEKDVFVRDTLAATTIRASVGHQGQQGNGRCDSVGISADGRFVVFMSESSNLDPLDFNGQRDIFLYDHQAGTSELVSRSFSADSAAGSSESPSITADGSQVCFWSSGTNIVFGDTNGVGDIFVWNRSTGISQRISIDPSGGQNSAPSRSPHIARQGRYVTFEGPDGDLVFVDSNGGDDVFVKDMLTGAVERAQRAIQLDGNSRRPQISGDGRYIVFESTSTIAVNGDSNGLQDVFLWDAFAGDLTRVSESTAGAQANGISFDPRISADGQWIAYESTASNLIVGDTNGLTDVFVTNRIFGATTRASLNGSGFQVASPTFGPELSGNGRFVGFLGTAAYAPGDTNQEFDVYLRDRRISSDNYGWNYCQSNLNSSGEAGTMRALQSPVLADNDLLFVIENLPTNQPGYMLMSDTQGFVPLFSGSQGDLCLGAPIVRFNSNVLSTGGGNVDFIPDLGALPQGTVVSPGQGWNFQFWFRDVNPGTTSNTTGALCVQLQ